MGPPPHLWGGWGRRSPPFVSACTEVAGCAALHPPYRLLPRPAENFRGDGVGLVELGEMAGAGDRADLGLAGDAAGEPVGVAARHDAILLAPEQQCRRLDQWQPLFELGVAERPEDAGRRLGGAGLLDWPFRRGLTLRFRLQCLPSCGIGAQ